MRYVTLKRGEPFACEAGNVLFDRKTDLVVAGLGTAGSIAAICAAEYGLQVIGIEQNSGMGGLSTLGCVWDYYYGSPGGRFEELNEECMALTEEAFVYGELPEKGEECRCYNGTAKEIVLEDAALQAGCEIWLKTVITGVYMEGKRVVGLSCIGESGSITVGAKRFIDATGSVLLCRMLGLPVQSGREYDGRQMRFSKTVIELQNGLVRGKWSTRGNSENKTPLALSRLILESGKEKPCLEPYYTEESRMIFEGVMLGIRESARIVARQELRFEDVLFAPGTKEPLFYAFSPVDNVNRDVAYDSEMQQIWRLVCGMHDIGISVGIPKETLLPRDCEGIIVAGKGIGVDSDLVSCIRMRKDMEKCGEAAAVLAYLSIRENIPLQSLPYPKVDRMMRKHACLNHYTNLGFARIWDGMARQRIPFVNKEDIKRVLATDDYGLAIIAILKNDSLNLRRELEEWISGDDELLSERSAFAAGLLGMSAALPILLSIADSEPKLVKDHPAYESKVAGAVYLLRYFPDERSHAQLVKIINRYQETAEQYDECDDSKHAEKREMAFLLKSLAEQGLAKLKEGGDTLKPLLKKILALCSVCTFMASGIPARINADTSAVSAMLGETTAFEGITVSYPDGRAPNVEKGAGRTGWKLQPAVVRGYWEVADVRSDKYLYCDIDGGFTASASGKNLKVEISYWDRGENLFFITYVSHGKTVDTLPIRLENTCDWKTAEFILAAPELNNSLEGSDFRISIYRDEYGYFRMGDNDGVLIGGITANAMEQKGGGELSAAISAIGHNFFSGEKLCFDLTYQNDWDTSYDLNLTYYIYDYEGNYVDLLGVDTLEAQPSTVSKHVELALSKYGVFYLLIEGKNEELGYYTYTTQRFAYIYTSHGEVINDKLGACNHFAFNDGRDPRIGYSLLKKAGMQWSRDEVKWDALEKEAGIYRLQPYQSTFLDVAQQYGIKHLLILAHGNALYGGVGPYRIPYTDEQLEAYGRYVYNVVFQLRGKVDNFEFWNEFDLDPTPEATPELYIKLAKITYENVKRANPNANTVGMCTGENDYIKTISDVFALGGSSYMEDISFHTYLNGLTSYLKGNPIDTDFAGTTDKLRELVNEYDPQKGLWLTETGYSSALMHRRRGAAYVIQTFAVAMEKNKLERMFIYDFICDGLNTNERERNFGMLDAFNATIPYAARPMYAAVSAMNNLLGTPVYKDTLDTRDHTVFAYSFQNEQTKCDFAFLWTTEESVRAAFDFGSDDVAFYDMYGNLLPIKTQDGRCALTLTECPVYAVGNFDKITEAPAELYLSDPFVDALPNSEVSVKLYKNTEENLTISVQSNAESLQLINEPAFTDGSAELCFRYTGVPGGTGKAHIKAYNVQGETVYEDDLYVSCSEPLSVTYKVSPFDIVNKNHWVLHMEIDSAYDSAMQARFDITEPEVLEKGMKNIPLGTLQPDKANQVQLNLPELLRLTGYKAKGKITLENGYQYEFDVFMDFLLADRMDTPPEIDGELETGEWNEETAFYAYRFDQIQELLQPGSWGGEKDLSSKGYLMWDSDYLYFACDVTDNVHFCPYDIDDSWEGDSIQFGILFNPDKDAAPQATEFILSLGKNGAEMKKLSLESGTPEGLANSLFKASRTEGHTIYEAKIAWQDILPEGFASIDKGREVAFSMLVNDNDGFGRRGWIEFASGIGWTKDSSQYATLRFE